MADDLADSVRTYKIHLEQVQAALTSDPGNEELLKLRADLEEVIALTDNLTETATDVESVPSTSNREPPTKKWAVGDICLAQWSEDKQWYKATIDAVTNDGTVAVSFERYGSSDVTSLSLLRDISEADKLLAPASGSSSSGTKGPRKRQMQEAQRQQQKKKKQKKFDRQKQIDEAHETDKMRWQQFNSKIFQSKKLKGVTRRSIFATPEAVNGRVGIGTCGIGGRPMTDYTLAEKRRRGM